MKNSPQLYQLIDNAFKDDNFLIKQIEGSEYTYIFFSSNGLFSDEPAVFADQIAQKESFE